MSPSSVAAGSAAFTVTVTGVNFVPSTVVQWDNSTALVTTYLSSTTLRAVVPASLVSYPQSVSVVPGPSTTFNFGSVFTVTAAQLTGNKAFTVTTVPVRANDMAVSSADGRLYLAVSSADTSRPNSLAMLDPQTAQFGTSVSTGSNPGPIAMSADGTYAYLALNDQFQLRRYTVPALQPDLSIPLAVGTSPSYTAADLAVQPTASHTVAVARLAANTNYSVQGDVVIFDDATARPQRESSGTNLVINRLLWNSNGQTVYGTSGAGFLYNLAVSGAGLTLASKLDVKASLSDRLRFNGDTGYIYTDYGAVLDPATGISVANFAVNAVQSGLGTTALMIPDSKLNLAYFLGRTIDGGANGTYVIEAFDLRNYNLIGTAQIPNVAGTPYRFLRWGSNGLAFLTRDTSGSGVPTGVYLVSGAFVTSPAAP